MALSSIANIKALLGISDTSKDVILQNMLDAVTQNIQDYCDRIFEDATFIELVNAKENTLVLRNRPINYLYYAGYGQTNAIKITYIGTSIGGVEVTSTGVNLTEYTTTTSKTFADYSTVALLSTAIDGLSNWTATSYVTNFSKVIYPEIYTGLDTNDEIYLSTPLYNASLTKQYDGVYLTDSNEPHMVIYNGGYTTLPQDLVELVNKMTIQLYYDSIQDNGGVYNSERIGNYAYTSSITYNDNISILLNTSQYSNILNKYRNTVI